MEKKYLLLYGKNENPIAAFENVTSFSEDDAKRVLTFTSDEGTFTFEKGADGYYRCNKKVKSLIEITIFASYRYIGRRTLLKLADKYKINITDDRRRNR